ncbi:dehydrogenase/reductase SDR family member 11-like [Folsomia candida]|uniref:dehydrogenase/reductase SDR family member 11-like n=1 Tax=Folsomia candida TaxID=158441 RepID=UPI000B908FEE|nr:dehydrogenase/reductase SDR family member 11-like [Folsomia candida]
MSIESGMIRWKNRVALVTGASVGIGEAICTSLVSHGMTVIGCARSKDKIDMLSNDLSKKGLSGRLIAYKCDVSNDKNIDDMFEWIAKNHGGVDVMVNNAGFSCKDTLLEITGDKMRDMLNVNVVGLVLCTSKAVKSMLTRGVDDGHIFNLNSMSGHRLTGILNFYAATKFAVTALTEGFRRELVENSKIRITAISPGLVETEFLARAFEDKDMAQSVFARCESVIKPQDIADILLFSLSSPPNIQIHDVLVRPCGEKI